MIQNPQNFILRALSADELASIAGRARPETLAFDRDVSEPKEVVHRVHFPEAGVISIITELPSGEAVEAGIIGIEGAAGLLEALGTGIFVSRGTVQKAGQAWSVDAADCRALFERSAVFRRACACSGEFQTTEARISMLCRCHHPVEQRMARWLLEMSDRAGVKADPTITLTQEHLALMLGVQRTTVSKVAHALRAEGLIHYQRGRIQIADPRALERGACACRQTLLEERRRILGGLSAPTPHH